MTTPEHRCPGEQHDGSLCIDGVIFKRVYTGPMMSVCYCLCHGTEPAEPSPLFINRKTGST